MPQAPTSTFRLDVLTSDPTLVRGLLAETADPLWMLSIQMALGEMQGVDGGSPAAARLTRQSNLLTRWLPRLPDGTGGDCLGGTANGGCAGGETAPLEARLENEQQPKDRARDPSARLAAIAGRQYQRLIAQQTQTATIDGYRHALITKYPLSPPANPDVDDPLVALAGGREIDGQALYQELDATLRQHVPPSLPPDPHVDPVDEQAVADAAHRFLAWYDSVSGRQLSDNTAWLQHRFEYQLALASRTSAGEIVLTAAEFDSGKLDWYDFDITPSATLGATNDPAPSGEQTDTYLPMPVTFHGGPVAGHWTFEDASVEIGAVEASAEDLATMAVVDFAVRCSNDFFLIPLILDVGTITWINSLTVTDTFGTTIDVPPVNQSSEPMRLFEHTVHGTDQRNGAMLLFPALAAPLDAAPFETVIFTRDEIGDICWAIEQTVLGNSGEPVDRSAQLAQQRQPSPPPSPPGDAPVRTRHYQLRGTVPANWYPLPPDDSAASALRVTKLAPLPGQDPQPDPSTRLLHELYGQDVPAEEITRDGLEVTRRWRFARGHDGTQYLWVTRRAIPAPAIASPDLEFDQTLPPTS